MFESVREYAGLKLVELGLEEAARARHRRFYARVAHGCAQRSVVHGGQAGFLELVLERENFEAAQENAGDEASEELAWISIVLAIHAMHAGPFSKLAAHADQAAACAAGLTDPVLRCRAIHLRGASAWFRGEAEAASRFQQVALVQARRAGLPWLEALVLASLGATHLLLGEDEGAQTAMTEAIRIGTAIGDHDIIVRTLGNLGQLRMRQRRSGEARALFQRQLDEIREHGATWAEGFALLNLAGSYLGSSQLDRSLELYERALEQTRACHDWRMEFQILCALVFTRVLRGDGPPDLSDVHRTLRESREADYRWGQVHALLTLAIVDLETGDDQDACATLEEALAVVGETVDRNLRGMALAYRVVALARTRRFELAEASLAAAREALGEGYRLVLEAFGGTILAARAASALESEDTTGARGLADRARSIVVRLESTRVDADDGEDGVGAYSDLGLRFLRRDLALLDAAMPRDDEGGRS